MGWNTYQRLSGIATLPAAGREIARNAATVTESKLMKPLTTNAVKYAQLLVVFLVVAVVAVLMNEKALTEKQKLEEKKTFLLKDSERLTGEIRILERRVTLLRTDLKTVEKVAKRKLGMARPDETVYVFQQEDQPLRQRDNSESTLYNEANPSLF